MRLKNLLSGILLGAVGGAAGAVLLMMAELLPAADQSFLLIVGGSIGTGIFLVWVTLLRRWFESRFHRKRMKQLDQLTPLENQTRRDSWQAIRNFAINFLSRTSGRFALAEVKRDYADVSKVYDRGAREIREALNELANFRDDDAVELDDWVSKQSTLLRSANHKLAD